MISTKTATTLSTTLLLWLLLATTTTGFVIPTSPFVSSPPTTTTATTTTTRTSSVIHRPLSIRPLMPLLQMSSSSPSSPELDNHHHDHKESASSLRTKLRDITGFSLTALRATLRATTGISLTAVRLAVGATTSQVVSQTMKFCLGIFPAWFRYFVQPFLVLYYWPLLVIKSLASHNTPAYQNRQKGHELVVEKWKEAVDIAEQKASENWPVHVDEETGNIVAIMADNDDEDTIITNGVAESVEVVMESKLQPPQPQEDDNHKNDSP